MLKIVVMGNCQAQLIEGLFLTGSQVEIISLPPNFTLRAEDEWRIAQAVEAADFVFVQRTAEDFWLPWARSSVIKAKRPGRAWVWPNLYFDGYFPGTQYLYLPRWNKVEGPLHDYHFSGLIAAHADGLTVDEAGDRLLRTPGASADPFDASLDQLRHRERDCDIVMSDVIASAVFDSQCFLTPNHPVNALLIALTERMAALANLDLSPERCAKFSCRLDHIAIPIFDWVAEHYRLRFPRESTYRGVAYAIEDGEKISIGENRIYPPGELIRSYFELYDVVLPR